MLHGNVHRRISDEAWALPTPFVFGPVESHVDGSGVALLGAEGA